MPSRPISPKTGLPLLTLRKSSEWRPGSSSRMSSYRLSLESQIRQLVTNSHLLSDRSWMTMLSNLLRQWFVCERELLTSDSSTILQLLEWEGLINLMDEYALDCNHS